MSADKSSRRRCWLGAGVYSQQEFNRIKAQGPRGLTTQIDTKGPHDE